MKTRGEFLSRPAAWKSWALPERYLAQMVLQVVRPETVSDGGVAGDTTASNQFRERLLHRHHAFGAADGKLEP